MHAVQCTSTSFLTNAYFNNKGYTSIHKSQQKLEFHKIFAVNHAIITGSIARSANLPVFSLLRGRFSDFRPAGATRCTDGGEIWHGRGDRRSPPPCQISPQSVQRKGCRTPKIEIFLLRFDQNVEYKRPAGAYPLRDFHKICRICTPFQAR